jgi:hypothetical protein
MMNRKHRTYSISGSCAPGSEATASRAANGSARTRPSTRRSRALRRADRPGARRRPARMGCGRAARRRSRASSCSTSSPATPPRHAGAFAGDTLALPPRASWSTAAHDRSCRPCSAPSPTCPSSTPRTRACRSARSSCSPRWRANDPGFDDMLDYAHRHRGVIARFGRFPHRNEILGRASTPRKSSTCASPAPVLMAPNPEHRRRRPCRPRAGPPVRRARRVRGPGRADPFRPARRRRWPSSAPAARSAPPQCARRRCGCWPLATTRSRRVRGAGGSAGLLAGAWCSTAAAPRPPTNCSRCARRRAVASVHPVRSFADPAAGGCRNFRRHLLRRRRRCRRAGAARDPAFEAIGARLVPIDAAAKTVYHAASVFASTTW